jgi:hypothetical protein
MPKLFKKFNLKANINMFCFISIFKQYILFPKIFITINEKERIY